MPGRQPSTPLLSVPGHPMSSLALSSITKDALSSITGDPRECPMIRVHHLITVWSPSLSGEFIKRYFRSQDETSLKESSHKNCGTRNI